MGLAVRDLGHVALRISHLCGMDAHWRTLGLWFWSRGPAVATLAPWPAPGMTLALLSSDQVPVLKPMDLMVEVSPRRVFANGHTYHINSISVNSDCETYMSADDLRINLWHLAVTDRSFSILSRHRPVPPPAGAAAPGRGGLAWL